MPLKPSNMIIIALFFLCIFLSGYWLKGSKKPYNGLKLNLHKFLSLGAVAYLIVLLMAVNRAAGLQANEIFFLLINAVLFLVLIISGGVLSAIKESPPLVLVLHRLLPFLAIASTTALLYFLLTN
jgi:hypothetical protein